MELKGYAKHAIGLGMGASILRVLLTPRALCCLSAFLQDHLEQWIPVVTFPLPGRELAVRFITIDVPAPSYICCNTRNRQLGTSQKEPALTEPKLHIANPG